MINRATSRPEPTLHITGQAVGFEIPDTSTIDHSFHDFTDAPCQDNRAIIDRFLNFILYP